MSHSLFDACCRARTVIFATALLMTVGISAQPCLADPPTVTSVNPNSGSASALTLVDITGTNFGSPIGDSCQVETVQFGDERVVFMHLGDTRMKAFAQGGSGTVHVTVTTRCGTSATRPADQFSYVPD